MSTLDGIPEHVIRQVKKSMGGGAGNLDSRDVGRLTKELRELNANLRKLARLEEKRLEMREDDG
ncbi:hypothetical protein [Salinibacter ruber]|uniref:Uncharacterized protein n=1 Tax=Salinibacter ruber TaxID=146919 RepID=A0AAW5P989_9BACT|nr:hypothetical protein [Salinibacter ruber]MCS4157801.1 hypothetical protein [Salinibacter ruber]